MTFPQQSSTAQAARSPFERSMIESGKDPAVAAELERRIRIVEQDEGDDASRLPLTAGEIGGYVAVSVAAVLLGILVVAL